MVAIFPGDTATKEELLIAVNNLRMNLADDISIDATEIEVDSTEGAPDSGQFTIGTEQIKYISKTSIIFDCTGGRGADGTAPAIHYKVPDGGEVLFSPAAGYHNANSEEIVAIEESLGASLANVLLASQMIDEDNMVSDSAVKVPTQQSVKAYADAINAKLTAGLLDKTRTINLTPGGAVIPDTGGCGITKTAGTHKVFWTLDFDKDTDEVCYFNFVVPPSYDDGNVVINIFCRSTATSGNVVFVMTTADVADAATFDAALGTTITFTAKDVDGTAGDIFVASKTADPGWTAGRLATIKLLRDVSEDNAAADVNVVLIEILWEVI